MSSKSASIVLGLMVAALVMMLGAESPSALAQVAEPGSAARCRVTGRVTSGAVPLPGVSIVVRGAGVVKTATSTDVDGTYTILFAPDAAYDVSADLPGFAVENREVTFGATPCDRTLDLQLTLKSRARTSNAAADAGRGAGGRGRGGANQAAAGRGGAQGFETLNVQPDAGVTAMLDVSPIETADASALLPAGFSLQDAQSDAVAIAGGRSATNLDRGLLNDRLQAINLGQFDPATGQFAPGFGPPGDPTFGAGGGFGGPERGGPGGPGGRGFGPGGGRGFGPGGRGGFVLGGRNARAQNPYQGSATYTFGGSALDSPPYQLRPDVPVTQPAFTQNTVGATIGGPLKIPGLYKDSDRRSTFQLNYTGNHSSNLFDQYATVPTDAMRSGDFSASPVTLIDPATGQPFQGNQIPASRIDPTAASLLSFIPAPNLPGSAQNFHTSTTTGTSSDAISLRFTQSLTALAQNGRGGPGGRGGGFGGRGFGGGGRGGGQGRGALARGTSVVLNGQLQYRRNDTEAVNVFPGLGGDTVSTSVAAPIGLNIVHGRTIQNINVNIAHSDLTSTNGFAGRDNVAGEAGIQYPSAASSDPANWGVPNLVFSGMSAVRGATASSRADTRLTAGYTWMRPMPKHQLRLGGDIRLDRSTSDITSNARGTFTFTGLYSANGVTGTRGTGADFADFLLGLPEQASLQVGQTSRLRQHSIDAYVEDNWQKSAKLTFNLGLRYELALPYVEVNGHMANLDAAPGFASVSAVTPGAAGPFTGSFPAGLLNRDANNLGPRVGFAYRLRPQTILRGGYGITYNSGSYSSIARELVAQPPFAETETITGTAAQPLTLAEALVAPDAAATTNNWGVDRDYELGMIQTWNASITRNLTQDWMLQAAYTGIKGTDLDVLRAPALGPGGVFIPGVQAFIWESSGGHSIMNAGNVQLRRRLAHGVAGGFSYTLAKAMDNASSLGAGGAVVAQNDRDLAAEWAPSTFDRRQQLSGNLYYELPWGPNRRWLNNGGTLAELFGEWSANLSFTLQTGTPLTARVLGAASDLLRGVNGSLRANYNGIPIELSDPTVDEFFNVTAFSPPVPGQFGTSTRNMIVGPGSHQLNALFQRDIRIGGNRAMTLQVNALNLLNTVQWAAVDTNINSPTFGQVISARPMRTMTVMARFRF